MKQDGVTTQYFVDEILQDNTDDQLLNDEDFKEGFVAGLESKDTRKAPETKAHSKIEKVRADLEKLRKKEEEDEEEGGPKKKKSKTASAKKESPGELTAEDRNVAEIYAFYEKMKIDELKDVLR